MADLEVSTLPGRSSISPESAQAPDDQPWQIVIVHYPSCSAEIFGGFATEGDANKWASRNIAFLNSARHATWRIEPESDASGRTERQRENRSSTEKDQS